MLALAGKPDIGVEVIRRKIQNSKSKTQNPKSEIRNPKGGGGVLAAAVLSALVWAPVVRAEPVAPELTIVVEPQTLVPGQAGYVYVGGRYPLDVQVTLDSEPLVVFWAGDGYQAFFAFGLSTRASQHTLQIDILDQTTGETTSRQVPLTVLPSPYPFEQLEVPARLVPLLSPDLNERENQRLYAAWAPVTPTISYDRLFTIPIAVNANGTGGLTSPFGTDRSYNGGILHSRHTGIDLRSGAGEPVLAAADGRVVLTEHYAIYGKVVLLDHGWGVYSLYAHLSEFAVARGDVVTRGQVIGATGSTGRTQGPHLHFGIIVSGTEVDPLTWLALLPGFTPPPDLTGQSGNPSQ
jgi:murein DD-endopeptidase MepM/ murein hydrolase activator NlpD